MGKFADYFGQLTLYDLFAYLLPGLPALAGAVILGWTLGAPQTVLAIQSPSGYIVVTALVLAYLLGHCMQGFADFLGRFGRPQMREKMLKDLESDVRKEQRLRDDEKLGAADLHMLARDLVFKELNYSPPALRDIFEYRVGYYRGMTLALSLIVISLFCRILRGTTSTAKIKLDDRLILVSDWLLTVGALLLLVVALAHYFRYRRFQALLDRFDALAILKE
jgi:hypothetical protein